MTDKSYPVSVRLSEEVKAELEDASWIEDKPITEIIKDGIELALAPIRAKHGGKIPPRPRRLAAEPAATDKPRGRRKK